MQVYDALDQLAMLWVAGMFVIFAALGIGVALLQPRKRPMATVRRRRWWLFQ